MKHYVCDYFLVLTMRVLIIDDDPEDYEIFCEAIQTIDPNIECPVAESGAEALQILQQSPLPDFIFLDALMPVMTGKEFLEEFNQIETVKHIPIVIYSSVLDPREHIKFSALGVKHFLIKKSNFAELCQAIKLIIT